MYKKIVFVCIFAVFMFLSGCSIKQSERLGQEKIRQSPELVISNQSNMEKENIKIPDLSGGKESAVRTSSHNKSTSDNVFYHGNSVLRQAALTFDDGPDIYFTTRVLDILKKNNIKATFFIMGKRAEAYPEMVKRIIKEGHAIGNHTWDHPNLSKAKPGKVRDEINKTEKILDTIVGYHPSIFRPPYGSASPAVLKEVTSMGYYTVDWSVDTRDWAGTPPYKMMQFVKKEFRPGGIVLQHCAGGKGENLINTLDVLPEIITHIKEKGCKFVTIPEMFKISAKKK